MRCLLSAFAWWCFACSLSQSSFSAEEVRYPLGPDSQRKEGVPVGKVTDHVFSESQVFPGTIRRYSVYVPAQYSAEKPAALMVFQDGHTYHGNRI